MRLVINTAATFRPFEVNEIKDHPALRISGTEQNAILDKMINSAVTAYEDYTEQILCRSTWDLYLEEFDDPIWTPAPLASVSSVKYYDTSNAQQTLSTDYYEVDITNSLYGRIGLKYGQSWPSIYDRFDAVIIQFLAGYASAAAIPQQIKDGLLYKIQELYYGGDMSDAYRNAWISYKRLSA